MGSGFSRHRSAKFHPSMQNRSTLQLIYQHKHMRAPQVWGKTVPVLYEPYDMGVVYAMYDAAHPLWYWWRNPVSQYLVEYRCVCRSHEQSRRPAMLKPQPIPEIPAETVRVVRAAFPKGNLYIHLRDTLGTIYQDELFADLYPGRGQPAYAPWRLALVTVFQFMENLTDRQAADAVRSRLDWK
jgi:hypothetical protein